MNDIITALVELIRDRKINRIDGSYTCALLESENKIVKKLGEENAEYIRSFLTGTKEEIALEAADYIYHLLVSLEYRDVPLNDVLKVLKSRYK